jgi:hypothetical protein
MVKVSKIIKFVKKHVNGEGWGTCHRNMKYK